MSPHLITFYNGEAIEAHTAAHILFPCGKMQRFFPNFVIIAFQISLRNGLRIGVVY